MLIPAALLEWVEWTINKFLSYKKAPRLRGFLFFGNPRAGLRRI
jgi:hypothetical protein